MIAALACFAHDLLCSLFCLLLPDRSLFARGSEPAVFDGSYDFAHARHVTRFHIGAHGRLDTDRL